MRPSDAGRPTVVLAERVDVGRRELSSVGVDAAYAAADVPFGDDPLTAGDRLSVLAARVARTWSRSRRDAGHSSVAAICVTMDGKAE